MEQKKSIKAVAFSKSKLICNKATYATVCNTVQHKHNIDIILNHNGGKLRQAIELDNARNPGMVFVLLYELLWGPYKSIRGGGKLKRLIMKQEKALKEAKESVLTNDDRRQITMPIFPRYLRVNKLKATVEEIVKVLQDELEKASKDKDKDDVSEQIYVDPHVPDLIVLSPQTRVPWHELDIVKDGKVILQDKSSCFSALALVHGSQGKDTHGGDFIDACAAPGNKTSHLAALIYDQKSSMLSKKTNKKTKVFGFDRSSARLSILKTRMSQLAPLVTDPTSETPKSSFPVEICPTLQDFLKAESNDKMFKNVKSILLDPSCSGSGIVNSPDRLADSKEENCSRIKSLSSFQLVALKHAMSFPKVDRIVYSTCSVHQRENEDVVASALKESNDEMEDKDKMWKLASPKALLHWKRRGFEHDDLTKDESNCLIRVNGLDGDDTNGFFVAYFERSGSIEVEEDASSSLIKICKGVKGIYNGEFRSMQKKPMSKPMSKNIDDEKEPKVVEMKSETAPKKKKTRDVKDIPKKAAKRLEWKRKQKDKKLERVQKQKAAKGSMQNKPMSKNTDDEKEPKEVEMKSETAPKTKKTKDVKDIPKKGTKRVELKRKRKEKKLERLQKQKADKVEKENKESSS